MPKDYYIQPEAPDRMSSADQVLAFVRQHVAAAKSVTGVDETGGEARIYAIDDHLIFKPSARKAASAHQPEERSAVFTADRKGRP